MKELNIIVQQLIKAVKKNNDKENSEFIITTKVKPMIEELKRII